MLPTAAWYISHTFRFCPKGRRKVAEIKYNHHFVIILPCFFRERKRKCPAHRWGEHKGGADDGTAF
jgi:hypothetical protein